jgi:hypothetical protein
MGYLCECVRAGLALSVRLLGFSNYGLGTSAFWATDLVCICWAFLKYLTICETLWIHGIQDATGIMKCVTSRSSGECITISGTSKIHGSKPTLHIPSSLLLPFKTRLIPSRSENFTRNGALCELLTPLCFAIKDKTSHFIQGKPPICPQLLNRNGAL